MPYRCPCPDSNESVILYKAKHKKKETELHVGVTSSGGAGVNLTKPILLKCNKCNLIFSEYIDVDFEDAYSHVVDESYIKQIKFKTKTFELFFISISSLVSSMCAFITTVTFLFFLSKSSSTTVEQTIYSLRFLYI